ncbi:MAG: hypothetical protein AB7O50_00480 [Pseudolabrys sp.]
MRRLALIAFTVLAGCSSVPSLDLGSWTSSKTAENIDPTVFPTNYKNDILQSLPQLIHELNGYKDAGVTDPVQGDVGTGRVYYVCVRGNPRTSTSGFLGDKFLIAYFLGGRINQLVPTDEERCTRAAYKPFPELESYCRGATCVGRR